MLLLLGYYYSAAPGLSDDAAYKLTKMKMELFTNRDQYCFIESAIRGGVSMTGSIRYAKANNTYYDLDGKVLKLNAKEAEKKGIYDPKLPTSFIVYLDCVNLYGKVMTKRLGIGNSEWLTNEEVQSFDVNQVAYESEFGYAVEADFKIPRDKHEYFKDLLPPLCFNQVPNYDDMSEFQKSLIQKGIGTCSTKIDLLIRGQEKLYHSS